MLMDEDYIFTLCVGDAEVKAKWTIRRITEYLLN
jgi:hypothetical protein